MFTGQAFLTTLLHCRKSSADKVRLRYSTVSLARLFVCEGSRRAGHPNVKGLR